MYRGNHADPNSIPAGHFNGLTRPRKTVDAFQALDLAPHACSDHPVPIEANEHIIQLWGKLSYLCRPYIITDLLQGFLLLAVGLGVVALGIAEIGGVGPFWEALPEGHRYPFGKFNEPATYHFVGDFWNDAVLNSFAFYIINQGILMRFLSAAVAFAILVSEKLNVTRATLLKSAENPGYILKTRTTF